MLGKTERSPEKKRILAKMKNSDRNKSRNRNAPDKRVSSGKTETAESELGRGTKEI